MSKDAAVTVIGAGSYGTSLAILLARNGHETLLWGHNPDKMAILQHDRQIDSFCLISLSQSNCKLKLI